MSTTPRSASDVGGPTAPRATTRLGQPRWGTLSRTSVVCAWRSTPRGSRLGAGWGCSDMAPFKAVVYHLKRPVDRDKRVARIEVHKDQVDELTKLLESVGIEVEVRTVMW
jgi:hypothetical protein